MSWHDLIGYFDVLLNNWFG